MHNAVSIAVSILPSKRGRPSLHSYSIRDLFLVTLCVALALGWVLDRRGLVKWGSSIERDRERAAWEAQALKRGIEKMGVVVTINSEGVHTDYQDPVGGRSKNSEFFHSDLAK